MYRSCCFSCSYYLELLSFILPVWLVSYLLSSFGLGQFSSIVAKALAIRLGSMSISCLGIVVTKTERVSRASKRNSCSGSS
jgi:hypothetical protein